MNINEGSIFEVMKLILPEHRGVMSEWKCQRGTRVQPVHSEDETQAMQYILSEAIDNGAIVRLTLFDTHGDEVVEGVPMFDARLKIATGTGIRVIDMGRLTKAELVNTSFAKFSL